MTIFKGMESHGDGWDEVILFLFFFLLYCLFDNLNNQNKQSHALTK